MADENAMVPQVLIPENMARLNITFNGEQGDLPDPVNYDMTDGDLKQVATEAVRAGGVPGIDAAPDADFTDFVIDRFAAKDDVPLNRLMLRPKTPFGGKHREWLRTWVNSETKDRPLNDAAVERALDIAESAFHGRTGVGIAARVGVDSVEKEIQRSRQENIGYKDGK